jgi:uncharacterized membrane protein YeaQ/YmgE (transglycosylase-associated protein family)
MNIISWILFGGVVGLIANLIDQRPARGGVLGAIILGIVGAIIGGFLGSLLLGVDVTGFNLSSLIVGVVGALVALFIGRSMNRTV